MRRAVLFIRWQLFLWRYREHMYLAVMEDDPGARQVVDAEAARRQLPPLPVDEGRPPSAVASRPFASRRRVRGRRGFLPGA